MLFLIKTQSNLCRYSLPILWCINFLYLCTRISPNLPSYTQEELGNESKPNFVAGVVPDCGVILCSICRARDADGIGKYDISFSLQANGPYQIDATQENDTRIQAIINDSSRHAVIYLSESRNINFEEAVDMVDELFRAANITNPDLYIRTIDGQRAILGVGSGYCGNCLLFTAAFPKYFGAEGTGLYVLVGSDFPWENTTRMLLDTLKVDLNRTSPVAIQTPEMGMSVGGSEYGLPLSRADGQGAEPAGYPSSDLIYDGYITFSNNSGLVHRGCSCNRLRPGGGGRRGRGVLLSGRKIRPAVSIGS